MASAFNIENSCALNLFLLTTKTVAVC